MVISQLRNLTPTFLCITIIIMAIKPQHVGLRKLRQACRPEITAGPGGHNKLVKQAYTMHEDRLT